MNERVNFHRMIPLIGIVLATGFVTGLFCYGRELYLDEWLSVGFVDILFLMVFIFELEYERVNKRLYENRKTTFSWVLAGYLCCCTAALMFQFFPLYFKPVMIIPILMCAAANDMIAFIVGLYFVVTSSMVFGGDYNELLCYCLLVLAASILSKALFMKHMRYYVYGLFFAISVMVPGIFYYWTTKEMELSVYLYGVLDGLFAIAASYAAERFLQPRASAEIDTKLIDILTEDYPQVKDLKEYSAQEFAHADKVSGIAYRYAKEVGLNENLCAAAGFYYRLGKWQGEPHIEKGLARAEELCFPEELIHILEEYYGEERKPSTPESALVHIVDSVVMKVEYLKSNVGHSQWNIEIMVYQILNEYMAAGLYDDSGLGMNQFLKIRENLVKEDALS